jgi:hypothetical protein
MQRQQFMWEITFSDVLPLLTLLPVFLEGHEQICFNLALDFSDRHYIGVSSSLIYTQVIHAYSICSLIVCLYPKRKTSFDFDSTFGNHIGEKLDTPEWLIFELELRSRVLIDLLTALAAPKYFRYMSIYSRL